MIRIVIAEDQGLLLGAMGSLLNLEEDMEVVGLARNGAEAIMLVHQLQPDICLMDIEMPEKSGLDAAEELKPYGIHVMLITTFARKGYFQRAIQADVHGYLLKDNSSDELAESIRSIISGERIYSSELVDEDSFRIDRVPNELDSLPEAVTSKTTLNQQMGAVRKYLSTILDKMKLPAG
jgi:two-component system response regulator DesR